MRNIIYIFIIGLVTFSCVVVESTSTDDIDEIINEFDYPLSEIEVPSEGLLGEYIKLSAHNLQANKLSFLFNDILANSYQQGIDTVLVEVPRNITTVNSEISILLSSNDSLLHMSNFNLKTPLITGVENTIVEFNEDVWIYGKNFDVDYNYVSVKLNGLEVGVNETTRDSLQVRIPSELENPIINVSITAQLQEVAVEELMNIKNPEITSVQQVVNVGDIMEVVGVNFNPIEENGLFIINDEIEAHTISVTGNHTATLRVPYGPYADFEIYKISYETIGLQTEITTNTIIDSDYILFTKNNINPSTNIRHYNDKSYAFVNDEVDSNDIPLSHLYELDYDTRTWTKIDNVAISGYSIRETITDSGELFVFVSQYGSIANSFYKIDLDDFSVHIINAPANNPLRISPAFFHLSNKIYYGKGRSGSGISDTYYTDLYSFDLTTESWTTLSTDGSQFYSSNDLDFQSNKFVQTYVIQTFAEYELKLFDPTNNSFTEVVPSSIFQINNVFNYLDKLLRVTFIPSTDASYFYPYNNQNLLTTLNTQQLESTSRYYAKGDQVFFYSQVINDVYAPSNGFYLLHPSISGQL